MLGRTTQGQQRFFLNTQEIPGIQSINNSFQTNASPMLYLGAQSFRSIPNGIPGANITINRYVVTQDYFIGLTGQTGFDGFLINDRSNPTSLSERNFSFLSGYMSSYRLSCGLDQIPSTSTNFIVYNKFGGFPESDQNTLLKLNSIPGNLYNESLKTPAPWTVDLNIDNVFDTNRIQSLELSINCPYVPLYTMGSRYPKKVEISYPIEVTCSFKAESDQMPFESVQNYPMATNKRNVSIRLRSHDLFEEIHYYNFNEMEIISEAFGAGVGQHNTIDGAYRLLLGRPLS